MVNQRLAEGLLQFRLGRAWDAYARNLGPSRKESKVPSSWEDLARQIRRQVVDRFLAIELIPGVRQRIDDPQGQAFDTDTPLEQLWPDLVQEPEGDNDHLPPEEITAAWIAQALAIQAWPNLAAQTANLRKQAARCRQWAELRQACGRQHDELGNGRPSPWLRFMSRGNSHETVEQARALLEQCESAFAQLSDECAGVATDVDQTTWDRKLVLERHIQRLLAEPANDWPPQRLSELQDWLTGLDPQWRCLLERLSSPRGNRVMWPEWSRWLERTFPETTHTGRARLLLVRSLVLALDEPNPPKTLRTRVEEVMHYLLEPSGLEAVLIHDPGQQLPAWFVTITDPTMESEQSAHIGLAMRSGTGPWTCFPQAEKRVGVSATSAAKETVPVETSIGPISTEPPLPVAASPQTATERALAELDALAKETEACVTVAQAPAVNFRLSEARAHELEKRWLAAKKDCAVLELEIVPAHWSFLETQNWQGMELPQNSLDAVFCNGVSRGVAFRIKTFGLRNRGGETLPERECSVGVSAGPCPAGLADLYAIVQNPASPGEESLKQRLLRWPRACVLNALDAAAERLFVDFWGPLGDDMRSSRKHEAGRFADRLSFLLERELRWRTFYPKHFQEFPAGWLLVDTERGAVTGNVRRVIRPGLKDADGNLRVQAKVDIE